MNKSRIRKVKEHFSGRIPRFWALGSALGTPTQPDHSNTFRSDWILPTDPEMMLRAFQSDWNAGYPTISGSVSPTVQSVAAMTAPTRPTYCLRSIGALIARKIEIK